MGGLSLLPRRCQKGIPLVPAYTKNIKLYLCVAKEQQTGQKGHAQPEPAAGVSELPNACLEFC